MAASVKVNVTPYQVLWTLIFWTTFLPLTVLLTPLLILAHYIPFIERLYYSIVITLMFNCFIVKTLEEKIRKDIFKEINETNETNPNLKILEVGPGTGINFPFYPSGSVITTLELNPFLHTQLDRLKKKHSNLTIDNMLVGNIEDVGDLIQDNSFDVVVGTHLFCCVKNKNKGLKEVFRILKPGGKFFVYENSFFSLRSNPVLRMIQEFNTIFHRFFYHGS